MTTLFQERFFPTDLLFRNFFNGDTSFRGLQEQKPQYPVDIYLQVSPETDTLCFDVACVGLEKSDIDITIEGNTLKVAYNKSKETTVPNDEEAPILLHRGIARRSFNMGWKVSPEYNLSKLDATMRNGLLQITVPKSKEALPKVINIK